MLPTLIPTAQPVAPIQTGKDTVAGGKPSENGGISFASLLPGALENGGGPEIVDGSALLAGLRATGSPATPTGKALPVAASGLVTGQPSGDPAKKRVAQGDLAKPISTHSPAMAVPAPETMPSKKVSPEASAHPAAVVAALGMTTADMIPQSPSASPMGAMKTPGTPGTSAPSLTAAPMPGVAKLATAGPVLVPANRIDISALTKAMAPAVPERSGHPGTNEVVAIQARGMLTKAIGRAEDLAIKPGQVASGAVTSGATSLSATPTNSGPTNSGPTAPATAAPVVPIRSVPSADTAAAYLPRSSAKSAIAIAEETPRTVRSPAPQTMASQAAGTSEQAVSTAPQTSANTTIAQPSAPIATAAQPAAAPANFASAPPPQSAEQPRDFGALVDRLVQARDAAAPTHPATVRTVLSHAEFGAVTVRFDASGSGLSVAFASHDPAFAPAARAALAADAGPRGDDQQRGGQNAQQQAQQQTQQHGSTGSGEGHAQWQSGSNDRARSGSANVPARARSDPNPDRDSAELTPTQVTQASQGGLYI